MASYTNKKSTIQLDNNRKRYALVAGNGIAVLMSDEHKYRRFDTHNKNAILNSLEALEYILAKCPTNDSVSEKVIDIGIPNCIKGVFGASFRQYIRTQKFIGSGEIIPVNMLDKMKKVVRMYNDRNFNVNIYSLSMANVDDEMVKIKQRALDTLYKVQVEDSQLQTTTTSQPVQGFTQAQVNDMIQKAVAQALASVLGQQPAQPVVQPAQPVIEPAPVVTETPVVESTQPVQSQAIITEDITDFSAEDFELDSDTNEDNPFAFDEEIPF